jgi:hypothetical protein
MYDLHTLDLINSPKWSYIKNEEFFWNDAYLSANYLNNFKDVGTDVNPRLESRVQHARHLSSSSLLNQINELFDVSRLEPIYDKDDRRDVTLFYDFIATNGFPWIRDFLVQCDRDRPPRGVHAKGNSPDGV